MGENRRTSFSGPSSSSKEILNVSEEKGEENLEQLRVKRPYKLKHLVKSFEYIRITKIKGLDSAKNEEISRFVFIN